MELIGSEVYGDFESEARERLGERDPEDWPILAAALAIGCPIWTEDTDFFGCGVPTWTTSRVAMYLRGPSEIAGNTKASNLIGPELVRLAAVRDFDKPGGNLGNEALSDGGPGSSPCPIAVQ